MKRVIICTQTVNTIITSKSDINSDTDSERVVALKIINNHRAEDARSGSLSPINSEQLKADAVDKIKRGNTITIFK